MALSHQDQSAYIVHSTQLNSLYDVCDGKPHEIIATLSPQKLELLVDGKLDETEFKGTPVISTNSPLYIGGVRSKLSFMCRVSQKKLWCSRLSIF